MVEADIRINDEHHQFRTGDTVTGTAEVLLPNDIPLENIQLAFLCLGEVKNDVQHPGLLAFLDDRPRRLSSVDQTAHKEVIHEEVLNFEDTDSSVVPFQDKQRVYIPFSFKIPKDLPSTMVGPHGNVKYLVRAAIRKPHTDDEFSRHNSLCSKNMCVQGPMEKNLSVSVSGIVEKSVILHGGTVVLYAVIDRKGFANGEIIPVHVHVLNKSNAIVVPRVTLHQVQIYMLNERHKTIERTLTEDPIVGAEVCGYTNVEELIKVPIPLNEMLSVKSSVITVKYFVHVTLNIPQSFDLHVNLPIVLTCPEVVDRMLEKQREPTSLIDF